MYEERKEGFSLKELLIQILFVVLFVFLLLWLFPTKSYVKDSIDNAYNSKLQPLYSQIYGQNLTTMKEAAVSYFTTDRLPSKVGDTVTLTLAEMQDKKLVLSLIDSNNKACDTEKSYVKIVKENKEYVMTVNLSCSDTSDYIEVHLGCYNYCESGVCEKKETTPVIETLKSYEYEYEKVLNGKWGDWSDWSEWSTSEVTATDYRKVDTKTEKVKVGTKTIESGTKTETIDALVNVTYSCTTGTLVDGNKCKISSTKTVAAIENRKYYCTEGTLVNGNQCAISGKLVDATATTTKYCENGTLSGTNCIVKNPTTIATAATAVSKSTTTYACPSGYSTTASNITSSTVCSKTTTLSAKAVATGQYTYGSWIYNGTYTYNSIQYSSDTRKVVIVSSSINTDCVTNCTANTYTYLVYTRTATSTYACPSGYSTTASNITSSTVCSKTTTLTAKTIGTTKTTTEYKCSTGTLSGNKCYTGSTETITTKALTKTTYKCSTGTLVNTNKCAITGTVTTAKYNSTYRCATGTLVNGNQCRINSTQLVDAKENKTYSCSTGKLSGSKCVIEEKVYKEIDIYSEVTYYRYQVRQFISGTRDVKWSSSQKDTTLLSQGYVLTGNKREK